MVRLSKEEIEMFDQMLQAARGDYGNAEIALLRADGGEALVCIIMDCDQNGQVAITPISKLLTDDEMKGLRLDGKPVGGE